MYPEDLESLMDPEDFKSIEMEHADSELILLTLSLTIYVVLKFLGGEVKESSNTSPE